MIWFYVAIAVISTLFIALLAYIEMSEHEDALPPPDRNTVRGTEDGWTVGEGHERTP
jgi:hypothetical protein